jgi:hypothetical protein
VPSRVGEPPQRDACAQEGDSRQSEDSKVKAGERKAGDLAAAATTTGTGRRCAGAAAVGAAAAAGGRDLLVSGLVLGVTGRRAPRLRPSDRWDCEDEDG